ncbi:NACHT domain-containing protein [Adhaeribacter swui]|uniref:NACHT domain-containing protein n=1 Tax=Adhaeribacter swui TaxID=2086471 RepID=A0A7G7GCG0_9BACT|nr:NACHT domain-containing protein [Adhaeribacter swui]QNF34844.1 NACHT domain-containing protein [Adhaeribacter swui]
MSISKRLPEVKTLASILPKGTAGGKEFARIVDLLLFHDSRRSNKKFTIFSDAAGDYMGLDSFEGDGFRKEGHTGYQYKYFPSPLSASHRKEIANSLRKAAEKHKESKIKKWILVTPENLTESSTRKDFGDVTWFENLRTELNINFEIEHWGHQQLLALFLETPSICLFYYPELINEGFKLKNTINETRARYNDNLLSLYKNIEFVGMSIYKQEATKGIPMENIYIPVKLIPEAADDHSGNNIFMDPVYLLNPGAKSVILGDPGSGKSTLLRFLSLCGISKPVQKRYNTKQDVRLPIFVVLRSYADELKSKLNLSLIDYILETVQADFNLRGADSDFFEYYLESGQAILLFDGLDELPDSNFKHIVRDRIRSLITTFPGNTVIVTSRVVGYDNPFRFDDKEFNHTKVSKLQLPEIEQFVKDWYSVRIESDKERNANINDLIRIVRDENHTAIKELAENPLLLTIVTLVHRIDAVLPDERVVLYQKCTETLLNTWQTWKFKDSEIKNKGKIERRNRLRMEVIANWMHNQSTGTGRTQRSIVPYNELLKFLTEHISEVEKPSESEDDPQDLANNFIDFIKKRAGLLIEVGDQKYSFVHLTFQEYLTSTYIITSSEKEGLVNIWKTLEAYARDPRWYEVIRLLIAGLKSNESQEFLIDKILVERDKKRYVKSPILLGGLLLDGVLSAEDRKEEILSNIILCSTKASRPNELRPLISIIRSYVAKEKSNAEIISQVFLELWENEKNNEQILRLILFFISTGLENDIITEKIVSYIKNDSNEYLKLFFLNHNEHKGGFSNIVKSQMNLLSKVQSYYSITSPYSNFIAATLHSIFFYFNKEFGYKNAFNQFLSPLRTGAAYGPFEDFTYNSLIISNQNKNLDGKTKLKFITDQRLLSRTNKNKLRPNLFSKIDKTLQSAFDHMKGENSEGKKKTNRVHPSDSSYFRKILHNEILNSGLKKDNLLGLGNSSRLFDREIAIIRDSNMDDTWKLFQSNIKLITPLLNILCDGFELEPRALWFEALRVGFLPKIPETNLFSNDYILEDKILYSNTASSFSNNGYHEALLILVNLWISIFGNPSVIENSNFLDLVENARKSDLAPVKLVVNIFDLIYSSDSKSDEIISMIISDNPEFVAMFREINWHWIKPSEINDDINTISHDKRLIKKM